MQHAVAGTPNIVRLSAPTDERDVSRILQRQIDNAPNGTAASPTVLRFPVGRSAGRYRVDRTLFIGQKRHLTLQGPSVDDPAVLWTPLTGQDIGMVDRHGNSLRHHVRIGGGSQDILVRFLRIVGPNTARDPDTGFGAYHSKKAFEHGFVIGGGAQRIDIRQCGTVNTHGDGVLVSGDARGVVLGGIGIRYPGRQGIALTHCQDVLIHGCTIFRGARSGIDFEPNSKYWRVEGIQIRRCAIDTKLVAFSAHGQSAMNNVWIHHNKVNYAASSWPMVTVGRGDGGMCDNWTIEDNVRGRSNPYYLLEFTRVNNVTVRRNTTMPKESNAKTKAGVMLRSCRGDAVIRGNNFGNVPRTVVRAEESPDNPLPPLPV